MKQLFKLLSVLLIFLISGSSFGQFGFQYNDTILVKRGTDTLDFAWAGGLSHAQFSSIDYNFDGMEDLFVFDRSTNQIRLFETVEENGEKRYEFVYDSRSLFPEDVRYRAIMVDYNDDGKEDLFTYGIGGIKVYTNTGNVNDGLTWEIAKEVLESEYASGNVNNLYVSSIDIPAYADVDGDTDIDVLTFHLGGERVEYHKNMSQENYGHSDSLEFVQMNECWGKFMESNLDNSVILNATDGTCGSPTISNPQKYLRHAGSSLLSLDLNDDNVMDLILGDVAHNNLVGLINGGTAPNQNSAMVSADENYPSNTTPTDLPIFPAPFFVDVDHDDVKDLVVGTNANGGSANRKSIWYYKNIGTNSQPNFTYIQEDFLQDQMIENGKGSIPVLIDLNNDGLKDLLISSNFRYLDPLDKICQIQYYQNTGSANQPEYSFVSDDWLSLSGEGYGLRMHPTFGDVDGDGDKDMFLGTEDGVIHFYERTGNGPNDFTLSQLNITDDQGGQINVFSYASPQLFDLNNDGLLDLIIGKRTAGISYYENIGTTNSPSWQLISNDLGKVDMGTSIYPDNYTVPMFVRHNDTTHFFAGNRKGTIYYYTEIDDNIADGDTFNLASDVYANIEASGYSAPYIDTIRSNNQYDMFLGTDLGGLWAYKADEFSDPFIAVESEEPKLPVKVYPNPSENGVFHVRIDDQQKELDIVVVDELGRIMKTVENIWGTGVVNISSQSNGVYTLLIKDNDRIRSVSKIMKF
tara:strand:- start:26187 stop:28427 length:2241 start_codon:yes stop_codon:yes gene_type:complete